MAPPSLCSNHLHGSLSGNSLLRAVEVLAEVTGTAVVLFDAAGEVVVGPMAGNRFIRQVLAAPNGPENVLAAHRAIINGVPKAQPGPANPLAEGPLVRFAVPVIRNGRRVGTLTLGDRPRQPLSPEAVEAIAAAVQADPVELHRAAADLPAWSPAEATSARNLAGLLVELLADLCAQDEELRRRIEELSAVYNIAGLFAGTHDLQAILDRTARMVCDVIKVKACSIRMLDEATGLLTIKAVHNLSDEYLAKGPVSVDQNPIDQAAVHGEMVRIADAPTDPRVRYPDQSRREGIVSGLVCGMIYRGKAVGVIRIYTGEPHVFSPYEEALLQAVASQAAAAIVNARLLAETLEAERYARQIAYAGEVQQRMFPKEPPRMERLDIGALYRPTYNVGGDFYDLIPLPEGNLGIGIADVSGKGVPASLLMASLRSALRVYAYFTYDVDEIMAGLNRHMCRDTTVGEFVTAFYGVITPDGRRLTYCNAGHDPPMLLRNGRISRLETGGTILGVECTARFDRGLIDLQPGDVLLLYTDGVVEAMNFADEAFGRKRLKESFRKHADQPAERIVKNINWDLRRFRGLADRTDDVTLVAIKVR